MSQQIKRVIESAGEPSYNDLWLDPRGDAPGLKTFRGGKWVGVDNTDLQPIREDISVLQGDVNTLSASKVDKVAGKGLSTNDFTDELKTKYNNAAPSTSGTDGQVISLQSGAPTWVDPTEGSIIDTELSGDSTNPVQNKVITSAISQLGQNIDEFIDVPHGGNLNGEFPVSPTMTGIVASFNVIVNPNTPITYGVKDIDGVWGGIYTIGYDFHFDDGTNDSKMVALGVDYSANYAKKIVRVTSWITSDLWTGEGNIEFWLKQSATLTETIDKIVDEKAKPLKFINIFDKIVFVGDSVTDGHIYDYSYGGQRSVVRKWSYPASMHKLCPSIECVNNGHSGESIQGYNSKFGTSGYCYPDDIIDTNLVIVELGWNQSGDYAWYSSQSDFETAFQNDVKQYGDNYNSYVTENSIVGNYCQLIKKIQNAIPNVSVICVASSNWSNLNNGLAVGFVEEMAEWLGVQFVNMDDTLVGDDAWNKGSGVGDDIHSTPFGYYRKAEIMVGRVSKCMQDNSQYFRWNLYKQLGWTNSQ